MATNSSKRNSSLETKMQALETGLDPQRADAFLDELLVLLGTYGHLICTVVEYRNLRVQCHEEILCETPIRLAPSKLRSLCARLAVRCREWSGREIPLYGDEVEFDHPGTKKRCKVRFQNEAGAQSIEMEDVLVGEDGFGASDQQERVAAKRLKG